MHEHRSEHARFLFAVKEHTDGTPFLVPEPLEEDLSILADGVLAFELTPGMSIPEAEVLAQYLNTHVQAIRHTRYEN